MLEQPIRNYLDRMRRQGLMPDGAVWEGFKCVLFDMDGVLYNSMPNHAIAWQQAMKQYGIHFTAEDAYATEGMRGIDTIRIYAQRQRGEILTEEEAQRMYDEKTRLFHLLPEAQLFEGVISLLRLIKEAGMPICVVTGSGQRPLIARLTHELGEFLDEQHIVSAYNVKRGKPAPDPYLKGLELAGNFQPWEGIVVENAPMGVKAGSAAHIFTIGVNSGPLPDTSLLAEGADVVLASIKELANLWPELLYLNNCRNNTKVLNHD